MQNLLKTLYTTRKFTIPKLVGSRAANLGTMAVFLQEARNHALGCCSFHPRVVRYLEFSDQCTSAYDLSDDRTHGEHHKFEVLAIGRLLSETLSIKDNDRLGLIAIALNEHDEGRRVTGDEDHESKGARMVRLRMESTFSVAEIEDVATAIGTHGGISVSRPNHLALNRSETAQILFAADKMAGLDPTRHTSYAIKRLGKEVDWRTFERQVIFTWHRALQLCRSSLAELEIDSREHELAAEDSMYAVLKALGNTQEKNTTVGDYVVKGVDVRALHKWIRATFQLELSEDVLPIYRSMF